MAWELRKICDHLRPREHTPWSSRHHYALTGGSPFRIFLHVYPRNLPISLRPRPYSLRVAQCQIPPDGASVLVLVDSRTNGVQHVPPARTGRTRGLDWRQNDRKKAATRAESFLRSRDLTLFWLFIGDNVVELHQFKPTWCKATFNLYDDFLDMWICSPFLLGTQKRW